MRTGRRLGYALGFTLPYGRNVNSPLLADTCQCITSPCNCAGSSDAVLDIKAAVDGFDPINWVKTHRQAVYYTAGALVLLAFLKRR